MNPTAVLSPQAHAARWPELTPQGWQILRALVAHGAAMGRRQLARAIGCSPANIGRLVDRLRVHGHVVDVARSEERATYAPLVGLTEKGADAGRERPAAEVLAEVRQGATDLPERVVLFPQAAALLRFLHAEAVAGRAASQARCAEAVGIHRSNVGRLLAQLSRAGCLAWGDTPEGRQRPALTPIGVAAAEGAIAIVTAQRGGAAVVREARGARAARAEAPTPPPTKEAHPAPAPAPSSPPLRHERRFREVGAPVAPPPCLPPLPAALARRGGITHPAPPQAHAAPAGMLANTWAGMTTIKIGSSRWGGLAP